METDRQIINKLGRIYPHIVRWGHFLGSYDYYIAAQLLTAENDNAPTRATHKKSDGNWAVLDDVQNPATKLAILGQNHTNTV